MNLKPERCALEGFIIRCNDGELQGHHIINKTEVLGNSKGRAILAACPPIIMAQVCSAHNVGRLADSPAARKILLLQNIYKYGWDIMKEWFDLFLATFKQHRTDLELERILSRDTNNL